MKKKMYYSPSVKVVSVSAETLFSTSSGQATNIHGMDALPSEPGAGFGW